MVGVSPVLIRVRFEPAVVTSFLFREEPRSTEEALEGFEVAAATRVHFPITK